MGALRELRGETRMTFDEIVERFARSEQLQQFDAQRIIGAGAFSTVVLGHDRRLERQVAIKLLTHANEPSVLLQEARLAAKVCHPHLVSIYACIDDPEVPAIVMEYAEHGALGAVQSPESDQIARWLRECSGALAALHSAGIRHGDIKPGNILVRADGSAMLADFGLADVLQPEATLTQPLPRAAGTLRYLAPELLNDEPATEQSDIYSLGVTFYELVAGRPAFPQATVAGVTFAVAKGEYDELTPTGDIDPEIIDTLHWMMCRDPSNRPARAEDIAIANSSGRAWMKAGPNQRSQTARIWPTAVMVFLITGLILFANGINWKSGEPEKPSVAEGASLLAGFSGPDQLVEAQAIFTDVIERQPDRAVGHAYSALTYLIRYANDERDDALLALAGLAANKALALDDQLALAHVAAGWVAEFEKQWDRANSHYAKAEILEPTNRFLLDGQARIAFQLGDYRRSLDIASNAIAHYPESRLFYDAKGRALMALDSYALAEEAFRKSIELDPDNIFAYSNLNVALMHQGEYEESVAVLQRALEIQPDGRIYTNLGTTLYNVGRYEEALKAFEAAVSHDKGSPEHYLRWANLADARLMVSGKEQFAADAYARAFEQLTADVSLANAATRQRSRAALYAARAGRIDEAEKWLGSIDPSSLKSGTDWYRQALTYTLLGDYSRARDALDQARARGYPEHLIDAEPLLAKVAYLEN